MKFISRWLIPCFLIGAFATGFSQSAPQWLLNVDFGFGTASPKVGSAATGQTASDFWNLYSRDDGRGGYRPEGELANLKWADGQASAAGLKVTNAAGAWTTGSRDPMFDSYLYPLSRSGNITVTVSSLPAGKYSFYIYAHGLPDTENAIVEVQSGPQSFGEKSTTTASGWNTTNWLAGQQYVLFENIVVSPADQSVVISSKPGAGGLAVLNGLQIARWPEFPPGCVPTLPGTLAWWRAENNATDATGASHGVMKGGAAFDTGPVGTAFSFNGSTSYIEAPDHESWAFGLSDFTIEFWVNFRAFKPTSVPGRPNVIFVANDEGQGTFNKWLFSLGDGRLSFHLYSAAAGSRFLVQAPFSPTLNRWYHLGVVRTGNVFAIHQDGEMIGSETANVIVPNANAPLTIGQGEGTSFLDGLMDELAIYRRALSDSEIKGIYQAGAAGKCASSQSRSTILARWKFDETSGTRAEDSAGPFDGVLSPQGAAFVSGGVTGNALSLSKASNGFVNIGDVLNLAPASFSVVAWVKLSNGDATPNSLVLSKHASGYNNGYFLNVNKSNAFLGRDDQAMFFAGDAFTSLHSTSRVNDGNWHQLVGVYQAGGNTLIYVDGASAEASIPSLPLVSSPAPFLIGGLTFDGKAAGMFNGLIDEVQVYRGALSGDEVEFLFRNPGQIVTPPLTQPVGNDGIPDTWRKTFFGADFAVDPRAVATADPDEDGANNYQEFLAGTNPLEARSVHRVPLSISTYSGSTQGRQDGSLASATYTYPSAIAQDARGRLFVTETFLVGWDDARYGGHSIRMIDTSQIVSTWAGGPEPGLREGPREQALFRVPNHIVFDSVGNAFVADRLNHRIRKIDTNGIVSTFAGSDPGFRDGRGTNAQFRTPISVAIDAQNNLYVSDFENARVRQVTPDGTVRTYAGSLRGYQDGPVATALFDSPAHVAVGRDGTVYAADWGIGAIRKITRDGTVSTFASQLTYIEAVELDPDGNVYAVVPISNALIKFDPTGKQIWRLDTPEGTEDGPISRAKITHFGAPFFFPNGDILVAEVFAHSLRLIKVGPPPLVEFTPDGGVNTNSVTVSLRTPVANGVIRYSLDERVPVSLGKTYDGPITLTNSTVVLAQVFVNNQPVSEVANQYYVVVPPPPPDVIVSTIAGSGRAGNLDARGTNAQFNFPNAGFLGSDRISYIADAVNHRIRRLDLATGDVSTIAGAGLVGFQDGPAATALFNVPLGVAVNAAGEIFVADAQNHRVRKISADSPRVVKTVAGDGTPGYRDGPALTAQLNFPNDLVFDSAGNLFFSEFNNHTIRKIAPDGTVSTFVGNGRIGFADGVGRNAQLNAPAGLAIDRAGNLYVTEWQSHRIRKVTREGVVTVLAGSTGAGFADGFGSAARFREPDGIVLDPLGNLFVTEHGNHAIRKITPQGNVSTVAGTGVGGFKDGDKSVAQFNGPGGLGWDLTGNLVVADTGNHRIRLVKFYFLPEITSPPQSQSLAAGASAVFQVKATGPGPLAHQWFFKDAPLPGATNATLTLSNIQSPNAGKYFVVISNTRGVVASAPVTLTVLKRPDFVQRDLPASYSGGSRLTVQLRATPPADATVYAVEEAPPSGWVVGDISDGGVYDAVRKKVKFGPFFDRQTRTLTYLITPPPNETGRKEFSGTVSLDGESGLIGGDAAIDSAPLHPADRNPADFRLAIDEVTAYGTAWRKGTRWPVEPNPIPIDFVTRAGTLWKNGEGYFYNSNVPTAPVWWEPLPASAAPRLQAPSILAVRSVALAERRLPERFVPAESFSVEIVVTPPAGVSVFAAQEEIPVGWTPAQISHNGEFDAAAGLVKWGPYFDNTARTLRYEVRSSPLRIDLAEFTGVVSLDGESIPISGPRQTRAGIRLSSLTRMTEDRLQLRVAGWPGAKFSIETSTDLVDWTPLQSFINLDATITIHDPATSTQPRRYYRAVER